MDKEILKIQVDTDIKMLEECIEAGCYQDFEEFIIEWGRIMKKLVALARCEMS